MSVVHLKVPVPGILPEEDLQVRNKYKSVSKGLLVPNLATIQGPHGTISVPVANSTKRALKVKTHHLLGYARRPPGMSHTVARVP
ncbi:hypothetical protein HDU87_008438 [Geranomyces variabilis]|uniref:Uncharacterized protein n=1 Tax=Geranomyces variabilis TaxID=109894 RepID=A0AAD5XP70_9FUNG|nr:hypothetical protein HDU87_008438 [Geranomyces variabilis]